MNFAYECPECGSALLAHFPTAMDEEILERNRAMARQEAAQAARLFVDVLQADVCPQCGANLDSDSALAEMAC